MYFLITLMNLSKKIPQHPALSVGVGDINHTMNIIFA